MSKKRIYVYVEGRMVPAWGENEPWGPAKAAGSSVRGEIVRGDHGPNAKKSESGKRAA